MLLLHIGRHKSGTSSLQGFLAENRGILAQQGFLYPVLGGPGSNNIAHHGVPNTIRAWIRDDSDEVELLDRLAQDVDGFHAVHRQGMSSTSSSPTVVLSSEAFQNLDPQHVESVFPRNYSRVVVYLREQVEYLLSAYAQAVHAQLETRSLTEFSHPSRHNFKRFLDRWIDAFGKDHLTVRIYDRERLAHADVRHDFLAIIGCNVTEFKFDKQDRNPSIGGDLLRIKREINRLITASPAEAREALYQPLRSLAQRSPQFRIKPEISAGLQSRIRDEHRQMNEAMFAQLGMPGETFTERDFVAPSRDSYTYANLEHVLEDLESSAPDFFQRHIRPVITSLRSRAV